jgi:hypothetical protein
MVDPMNTYDLSLTEFENWLLTYIEQIECTDDKCRRAFESKRLHSFKVAKEIETIGRRMRLDRRTLFVAEIIGLLHDVGRFEQFKTFGTFNDYLSLDHGDLGARIIAADGALTGLGDAEKKTVIKAIRWHNKITLPDDADEEALFYARLIRDADKLDIYRLVVQNLPDPGSNPALQSGGDIPEALYEDLMAGRRVCYKDIRSDIEMRMMQLNWITDINFTPTLELIEQRDYLQRIAASLPHSGKIDAFVDKMRACLSDRLNQDTLIAEFG